MMQRLGGQTWEWRINQRLLARDLCLLKEGFDDWQNNMPSNLELSFRPEELFIFLHSPRDPDFVMLLCSFSQRHILSWRQFR
jgi:hypothetical protein